MSRSRIITTALVTTSLAGVAAPVAGAQPVTDGWTSPSHRVVVSDAASSPAPGGGSAWPWIAVLVPIGLGAAAIGTRRHLRTASVTPGGPVVGA